MATEQLKHVGEGFLAKWDALAKLLVLELRGEDPPSFQCRSCRDMFYAPRENGTAWFCRDCDKGKVVEAGYWFDKMFPVRQGAKRIKSITGHKDFHEYKDLHFGYGYDMEDLVRTLARDYEHSRKRKLSEE